MHSGFREANLWRKGVLEVWIRATELIADHQLEGEIQKNP